MPLSQEIKGKTLKVYLYLLKNGPSELRDIQHGTGLSSPSLVSYHLGKLIEIEVVKQTEYGQYFAPKEASSKVLDGYSKIGSKVIPQLFFFTLFFTILIVFFSIATIFDQNFSIFLILTAVAMIVVFWFETAKLWRRLAI